VQIWPVTTPFIKTYRLATPLLVLQVALIPGGFLIGFMLSPLLWLSRHIAQRPVRRLRFPQEKPRYRRALAAGFYVGSVLITVGLIGTWSRWCLGNRDPWLWVIFWILEGKRKWSRPLLLAYWALLGSISVAGWNRQLARSRRYRPRNTATGTGENVIVPVPEEPASFESSGSLVGGINFPNLIDNLPHLPNIPNGANVSLRATDILDAADKHVPTLGLNARRKFFHALAVAMFLPGVAFDVRPSPDLVSQPLFNLPG
jgi:dolichol kinase